MISEKNNYVTASTTKKMKSLKEDKEYKREMFDLFNFKSYDEVKKNRFNEMLDIIDEYPLVIQDILLIQIMPYFKTIFFILDCLATWRKLLIKLKIYFLKLFLGMLRKL